MSSIWLLGKKFPPCWRWKSFPFDAVTINGRLTDRYSEFSAFADDSRWSPCRIGMTHGADHFPKLVGNPRSTRSAFPGLYCPKPCESPFVRVDNCSGTGDLQESLSSSDSCRVDYPKYSTGIAEPWFCSIPFQHHQLMTESKILQHERISLLEHPHQTI